MRATPFDRSRLLHPALDGEPDDQSAGPHPAVLVLPGGSAAAEGVQFSATEVVILMVGFTEGLTHLANLAICYLFKDDLGLSPSQVSMLFVAPSFPWLMKPLFAFYSDSYPVLGMRRKPYLCFFSFAQSLGYAALALGSQDVIGAVLALFVIAFASAFCSAIAEALLVETAEKLRPFRAPADLVSSFQLARALGSLTVAYFSGALLEKISKRSVFLATAAFPLIITAAALSIDDHSETQARTIADQVGELAQFLKQRIIWGPALFILAFMIGPDYDDALFFYYTNVLGLGPAFMGSLKLTYGIATLVGTLVYQHLLQKTPYRKLLAHSILWSLPVYLSPLILISGLNLRLGISDKVFVLSGGFLNEAVAEIQIIPLLVIVAALCPAGLEGTAFATLFAVRYLGSAMSKANSAIAMHAMGITASRFTSLSAYIWICGAFNLLAFCFIHLIPSEEEVEQARETMRARQQLKGTTENAGSGSLGTAGEAMASLHLLANAA